MDVHPPHEPIHTWRDFLLHLATITVGLLIALGLEAAVEAAHHRHLVKEARENIRRELEENAASAREDLARLDVNKANMQRDMATLRAVRKDSAHWRGSHLTYEFSWESFNESAWSSARDSGALTFMPVDEVQRYADAYHEQEAATRQAESIFSSEVLVAAPLLIEKDVDPTPDQAEQMMRETAETFTRLYMLRQIVEQLDQIYTDTLRKK